MQQPQQQPQQQQPQYVARPPQQPYPVFVPAGTSPGMRKARSWRVVSAVMLVFGLAGACLMLAALLTPCWTSRSYLLFNTPAGSGNAPDVTMCFGLRSVREKVMFHSAPDTEVEVYFHGRNLSQTLPLGLRDNFNLDQFRDVGKGTAAGMVAALVFAVLANVAVHCALMATGAGWHKATRRAALLFALAAAVTGLASSLSWVARTPSADDWYFSGGRNTEGYSATGIWYSHYFDNPAGSLAMAITGSLLMLMVCAAPLVPLNKPAPADEGAEGNPLLGAPVVVPAPDAPAPYRVGPPQYVSTGGPASAPNREL